MLASSATGSASCEVIDVPACNIVLLAEDDDCVAGLLTRILARRGLRVLRAREGRECERLYEENETEIVLVMLDRRLPDVDGTTIGRRLRQRVPDLPIILTSGQKYAGPPLATGDMRTTFLPKPFFPAEVERQVRVLLDA